MRSVLQATQTICAEKILRIKPLPQGGYTIPEGNLFPKYSKTSRPEIYAMGCRNPYRIHVDQQTGYLYWGDVGQNTELNPARGPISYDEFHQAKGPGFFGWPYFAGNNQPYTDFDFETNMNGTFYDSLKPINNSRNNTGDTLLPPAQPAFIWYSYAEDSSQFQHLGSGVNRLLPGRFIANRKRVMPTLYRNIMTASGLLPNGCAIG